MFGEVPDPPVGMRYNSSECEADFSWGRMGDRAPRGTESQSAGGVDREIGACEGQEHGFLVQSRTYGPDPASLVSCPMELRLKKFTVVGAMALGGLLGPSALSAQRADFVFLIDATSSMGGEIASVKSGLGDFVTGLNSAAIDYRFAVVLYGGAPELVLDWTTSASAAETAFDKISVSGAVAGFQNNHNVNPEAGLEAIRIALGAATDSTLVRDNVGGTGGLDFRANARKNLILVTDEDSDRPFYVDNRFTGQSATEPPSTLTAGWQAEVDATADALIGSKAFINMIINASDTPAKAQYGDPSLSAQDANFLNFDPDQTLLNLNAAGLGDSLEAQVLAADLVGRAFNIGAINSANFVNNFFAAKIEEIIDNPLPDPGTPDGGMTLVLFGLGALPMWLLRRR